MNIFTHDHVFDAVLLDVRPDVTARFDTMATPPTVFLVDQPSSWIADRCCWRIFLSNELADLSQALDDALDALLEPKVWEAAQGSAIVVAELRRAAQVA